MLSDLSDISQAKEQLRSSLDGVSDCYSCGSVQKVPKPGTEPGMDQAIASCFVVALIGYLCIEKFLFAIPDFKSLF